MSTARRNAPDPVESDLFRSIGRTFTLLSRMLEEKSAREREGFDSDGSQRPGATGSVQFCMMICRPLPI